MGGNVDIEVHAEGVGSGDLHRSCVEVALILSSVPECEDRPARVCSIRAMIVNANVGFWDRRLGQ